MFGSGGFNVGGGGDEPPRRPSKPTGRRDSVPQSKKDEKDKEKQREEDAEKSMYVSWLLNELITRSRSRKTRLSPQDVDRIAHILATDEHIGMDELGHFEQLITGEQVPVGNLNKQLRARELGSRIKTEGTRQNEINTYAKRRKEMEKRIKELDLAEHEPEHDDDDDDDDDDDGVGEGMAALGRINLAGGGGYKHGGIVKGKKGKAVSIVAHAGELVVPVQAVAKVLKSSAWIDHVKSVQKAQGITYKEAMKVAKGSYEKV